MKKSKVILLVLIFSFLLAPTVPTILAQTMTLAPSTLILNAQGRDQDLQANIGMYIPSGYGITSFEISMYFDGTKVSEADDARYCYIDDMLLVSFDRAAVQADQNVIDMAGSIVTATVVGWVTVTNSDGDTITIEFNRYDYMEIRKPGKK